MPSEPKTLVLDDLVSAAQRAAEEFAFAALNAVNKRGWFVAALSGGSTPKPFYRVLAEEPHVSRVPWDGTHIFWVDERCVPAGHAQSNYGAAKKGFLDRVPIPRQQIHPMNGEAVPSEGAQEYEKALRSFFRLGPGECPVFDLVLLGVGKDGHVASLFPGQDTLGERQRAVIAVRGGEPDVSRITVTLPVLQRARELLFLVSGRGKAPQVTSVFKDKDWDVPVQRLVDTARGEITWLLDRGAASGLRLRRKG